MKHVGLIGTALLAMMFGCAERPKAVAAASGSPTSPPSAHAASAPDVRAPVASESETTMATPTGDANKIIKSDEQWRKELTPEQYRVMRQKGTERPFSGKYWDTSTPGVYKCAACGEVLFESETKFDAGCGWPSFSQAVAKGKIEEHLDTSHGMTRTEVTCAKCGAHLGHVFDDGPVPTGLRYCINSVSIELEPEEKK